MKNYKPLIFVLIISVLLGACAKTETTQPAEDALADIHTSVALTLTGEPVTVTTTQTPEPSTTFTPTPEMTDTLEPAKTATITFPTATSGYYYYTSTDVPACDDSVFIKDVTIPDGTEMAPGETFTKTWKIQNTGTCEWTTDYYLIYLDGKRMSGSAVALAEEVEPGDTVKISIEFVAPSSEGTFSAYWIMQNEDGVTFGDTLYVEIEVDSGLYTSTPKPSKTPTLTGTPVNTSTPDPTSTPENTNTSIPTTVPSETPETGETATTEPTTS